MASAQAASGWRTPDAPFDKQPVCYWQVVEKNIYHQDLRQLLCGMEREGREGKDWMGRG